MDACIATGDAAPMSESGPLVPWAPPERAPADLSTTSRPQRPIFTIIVLVTVTVVVTGILTGRLRMTPAEGAAARSDGAWAPTATTDIAGDSWDGNLVTDGSRVYLLTREDIEGFWGVLKVRWSDDAGSTWSEPVRVSSSDTPDAARHTLAIEPDGTLWAAWAERGPKPVTQRLTLRRSRDRGQTWDPPTQVSIDDVGEIGIPALVMTPEQRFVAYTDGVTGNILVQRLYNNGEDGGNVVFLYATQRNLYTDEPFRDGGLAATAVGGQAVIATHSGDHVSIRVTKDHIASHATVDVDDPVWAAPRLAADGGRLVSMVATRDGPKAHVVATESDDGGETWTEQGRWDGTGAGDMSLAASPAGTVAAWQACRATCRETQLRVSDVATLTAGGRAIERTDGSHPVGAVLVGTTLVVAWVHEGPTGHAWERVLTVASGPLP
jgi:hypothetical protein